MVDQDEARRARIPHFATSPCTPLPGVVGKIQAWIVKLPVNRSEGPSPTSDVRAGVDLLDAARIGSAHRRFHGLLDEAGTVRVGVAVDETNDFSVIGRVRGADHEGNRFSWRRAEAIAVPDQSHGAPLLYH